MATILKWLFRNREINPCENPRKWINRKCKKSNFSSKSFPYLDNALYIDENERHVDKSKYFLFIVNGNKMEACGIKNNSILMTTTPEYLISKGIVKKNPIAVFSDGNICQIAFQGHYMTPIDEVWKSCKDCKTKYIINKKKKEFREYVASLLYRDDFEDEYIIAFKYVWDKDKENYRKEWHTYFKSELVAIGVYYFTYNTNENIQR